MNSVLSAFQNINKPAGFLKGMQWGLKGERATQLMHTATEGTPSMCTDGNDLTTACAVCMAKQCLRNCF